MGHRNAYSKGLDTHFDVPMSPGINSHVIVPGYIFTEQQSVYNVDRLYLHSMKHLKITVSRHRLKIFTWVQYNIVCCAQTQYNMQTLGFRALNFLIRKYSGSTETLSLCHSRNISSCHCHLPTSTAVGQATSVICLYLQNFKEHYSTSSPLCCGRKINRNGWFSKELNILQHSIYLILPI